MNIIDALHELAKAIATQGGELRAVEITRGGHASDLQYLTVNTVTGPVQVKDPGWVLQDELRKSGLLRFMDTRFEP